MRNWMNHAIVIAPLAALLVHACAAGGDEPEPSGGGVAVSGTDGMSAGPGVDGMSAGPGVDGMSAGPGVDGMSTGPETSGVGASPNNTSTLQPSSGMPAATARGGSGGTNGANSGTGGLVSGAAAGMGGAGIETDGSAGSSAGGASGGTGGSSRGGAAGAVSDSGTAGAGGANTGGSGETMSAPVTRPPIDVEGTVPSQYGNPVANPGQWTPHTYPVYYYVKDGSGLTEDDTVEMQDTPIMKECNIYTPPGYDPEIEYPLILVLHGITDNHDTWMERGDPKPDVLLDNLITAEIIEPVIAVFAQGDAHEDWASHDDFGDDGAGYFTFGNELMNDLLPYVEDNYSVKKDRNYRAFSGFSYGGRQTVNIGLSHHLQHFAWFGAFAAAGGPYGATQIAQYLEAQDISSYPLHHFYSMGGASDSLSASTVNAYEQQLPAASSSITSENFTAQIVDGGHDYPTVTIGLYNFLRIAFGL